MTTPPPAAPARIPASEGVLARATAIVRAICESGEDASISALSERLGITPSSVHRLLDDLVRARWVERTPHHRYRVGFELYRLGALSATRMRPVRLARPVLAALVARCHETAVFALRVPEQASMVLAEQADPPQPLRWRFAHHIPRSLLWGAPGRAMLAHLPDDSQQLALSQASESPRGRPAPDWNQWQAEAARIRSQGYAVTEGHFTELACGMASPVFDHAGVVGAIACIVARSRFEDATRANLQDALPRAARTLSRSLGAPLAPGTPW